MASSLTTLVQQLNSAGAKYNVPSNILLGVFGMETSFGNNVKTSSTGAMGNMQFEPGTAAQYGYPMTNSPSPSQAQQQFDAAAHYLSDLYKATGNNWNAALQRYSGGGYGLSQVQAKAQSATGTSGAGQYFGGLGPGNDGLTSNISVPNPLSSVATAITDAFKTAVGDAKYAGILIGVLILGVLLISRAFSSGAGHNRTVVIPA